jgi:hypothetical protein
MPSPVYIICAETGALDSVTGLPSYFNVFDTLYLGTEVGSGLPAPDALFRARISAVWMQSDADVDTDYEHAFVLRGPDQQEQELVRGAFRFERPLVRFDLLVQGPLVKNAQPGILYVISRVRGLQSKSVVESRYPLRIEIREQSAEGVADGSPSRQRA